MNVYPLKFEPIYKERIWGGEKLKDFFDKEIPAGAKIGESWELADLPQDKSVIINGTLAGKKINEILKEYPEEITGGRYKDQFPLLIKILDAQDILSVQVHPDAETCKRMGKGNPKTECWYIIAAETGACIYKGLKPGTTKEQFARAIEDGSCAELLNKVPVKVGQCHFLGAGTAHAIGAGLLIAEIQTPSDTTYRVFDWNRLQDGQPRQLHIAEAMESIHFDQKPGELSVTTSGRLVDSDVFKIDKIVGTQNSDVALNDGLMKVLMIIEGAGRIKSNNSETIFAKGQTILIPAIFDGSIEFDTESILLSVKP